MKRILATRTDLAKKLEELEKKLRKHDRRFDRHAKSIRAIFEAIQALIQSPEPVPPRHTLPPIPKIKGFTAKARITQSPDSHPDP